MFADQPDNAKRIEEIGAGIAVFEPDTTAIKAALERVWSDSKMRDTTENIAKEMASTSNYSNAVDELLSPLQT